VAQFNDTLENLRGSVLRARPGLDPTLAETFLNYRMREVIAARPYWSGLITRGVLDIPNAYSTGTVSLTEGSPVVNGVATAWPVSDVVNTTLVTAVTNTGYQSAAPASMTNVTTDTLLYVGAGGPNPEVVAVNEITPSSFRAKFQSTHAPSETITASSLAYRQFYAGFMSPVYTVIAVTSTTSLLLDLSWAGTALSGISYQIYQSYYTFAPDLVDFISVVDPANATQLQLHYPKAQLDWDDPQRSATEWPQYVCDYSQNLNGNMQYELWPNPTSARQLYFTYIKQWPEMKARTDRPPSFFNPSILVYGALSDAFKVTLPGEQARNNLNLNAANMWEQRFQMELMNAMQADNGKAQAAYTWARGGGGLPGGNNFWQTHDPDVWMGNY
jgi:hypothetical protein